MYANGQLERDPVLDEADAELGRLLDVVDVPNQGQRLPEPNYSNQAHGDGNESETVKREDWQVLVLLLSEKYHVNVSQDEAKQGTIDPD